MRLPMGNFGQAMPTAPRSGVIQDPGSPNLRAIEQAGKVVSAIGQNEYAKQQAEKERETKLAVERADRAATITAEARMQNGLADLADDIGPKVETGQMTADEARQQWKDRSKSVVEEHANAAPEAYRDILKAQAEGLSGRLSNRIEDGVRKRAQSEIGGQLTAFGEEQQRAARRDIAGATAKFEEGLNVLGPQAGMTPEQIAVSKQRFREQTRYTQAYDLMNAAGESARALRDFSKRLASDEFMDIDPQRRAALESSVQSKIATLENRAAIRQEAAMRQAEAAYTGFLQFMDGGRMPSQEYTQKILSKVKGTPYEAGVMEAVQQAPSNVAFATAPIDAQKAALRQMQAQLNTQGSSPQANKEYEKRAQMVRKAEEEIEKDAISAALSRNVVSSVPPVDASNLATLPQQIAARAGVLSNIGTWTGRPASPLTADEADQLGKTLSSMKPDQQATALRELAKSMPKANMLALSKQMEQKDDKLAIAATLSLRDTTEGRNVGALYLKGKQALSEGRVKPEATKSQNTRAAIFTELDGLYRTPQAQESASEAVMGVYAQLRAEGVSESKAVKRAVSLVTGGIKEHNGRKITKPYGWSDEKFDDWLTTVGPSAVGSGELVVGGVKVPASQVGSKLGGAALQPYGDAAYLIESGADVVRNPDGSPYVLRVQ